MFEFYEYMYIQFNSALILITKSFHFFFINQYNPYKRFLDNNNEHYSRNWIYRVEKILIYSMYKLQYI